MGDQERCSSDYAAAIHFSEVKPGADEALFRFGLGYESMKAARDAIKSLELLVDTEAGHVEGDSEFLADLHDQQGNLIDTVVLTAEVYKIADENTRSVKVS